MIRPAARLAAAVLLGLAAPAAAQDDADRQMFIDANLLATYYHELGHALIDVAQAPVLGREEDAADALSTLLIHEIWEPESATGMLRATAAAWVWSDAEAAEEGLEPAYWDVHSLDLQRYYTQVCLFYGADPEARAELAQELELPEERAEGCEAEYALAADSWDAMLAGLAAGETEGGAEGGGGRLILLPVAADDAADAEAGEGEAEAADLSAYVELIASEVADFNRDYHLPVDVEVAFETCGEANAFYDPETRRISLCTEYIDYMGALWDAN